jgi:HK97 family phage major capsid protein
MTEVNTSELAGAFNAFKETFEKKQKDADVLITAAQTKTAEFIASQMQKTQDIEAKNTALEQEVKTLAAVINRTPTNSASEANEAKTELQLHLKSFIKDGGAGVQTFDDYMKGAKVETKALREGVDTDGGYLVRADFMGLVNTRIFETTPMRTLASVQSITSNRLEFVADDDEASVSETTEEGSRSVTNTPTLGARIIEAHEIYGLANVTKSMLQDVPNIESWIANKVADRISRKENTNFVTGNGVGKARGFLTYAAWASAGVYESGKVEQVSSGSSANFTYAGLAALQGALKEAYQRNAKFLFKRSVFASKIMTLVDGQQRPIFNMDFKSNTLGVGQILGAPVVFADDMPAAGADSLSGAYGDFGAGYMIVDRLGLDLLRDPYSAKPYVQFYATKRSGGDVANFEAIKIQKLA